MSSTAGNRGVARCVLALSLCGGSAGFAAGVESSVAVVVRLYKRLCVAGPWWAVSDQHAALLPGADAKNGCFYVI